MAEINFRRLTIDTLASIAGYTASIIPPPAPAGNELKIFNGLTEPDEFYGIWFKTEDSISSSIIEIFFAIGEGTWESNTFMPSGDYYLAGASVGTKVYMCGGSINTTATRIYDTATGVWTTGSAMPSGDYRLAGASVGTKVYMCGGSINTTATRIYDTATGVWTTGSAMPSGDYGLAGASVGTKVYMCGGVTNKTATRILSIPNLEYLEDTAIILTGKYVNGTAINNTKILDNVSIEVEDAWLFKNGFLKSYETYIGNGTQWNLFKLAS